MKYKVVTLIIFFCMVLFGCATGSTIITGEVRSSVDPSEVRIFLEPPSKFETIGIVEASSDVEFSRQSAQDRVINELKNRAAKIGANGILLTNTGSQAGDMVGYFSSGIFFTKKKKKITGQARAIYVIQE
jgi:hypothetical protein